MKMKMTQEEFNNLNDKEREEYIKKVREEKINNQKIFNETIKERNKLFKKDK